MARPWGWTGWTLNIRTYLAKKTESATASPPFGPFEGKMLPDSHFIRNPFDSLFTSRSAGLWGVLDLQWLE